MTWYRTGTVSVTNGSPAVVGVGTFFTQAAKVGDIFIGPDLALYEITAVTDDTHLSIKRLDGTATYAGATLSAQAYAIIRNFTSTLEADLASRLATLLSGWQGSRDEFATWVGGTVGGGPNSDGTYPMTTPDGVTTYVECPAQFVSDMDANKLDLADVTTTPTLNKVPRAGTDGRLLPGWLPASELEYVGIAYNVVTDTFQRLGAAQGWPVGMFPGVQISPIYEALRRVTLTDAGAVYKGISWLDFTLYEDGTTVDRSGGDGQIMVEYLPAYWRCEVVGDWIQIKISHQHLPGFDLHPLFEGVDAAYQGAYEMSVVNEGGTDKACSIALDPADGVSPVFPVTTRAGAWGHASLTTAAGDTLSAARGTGWQQYDYLTMHWERLLMVVGFAGFNFQSMVGSGRANLSGGDWLNDIFIGRCGLGDAASGYYASVANGGSAGHLTDVSTLLGIENQWGNVWKRNVLLLSDNVAYYKPLPPYDYTTTAAWTALLDAAGAGVTLPAASGYGGVPFSGLAFGLPQGVTGTSSTRLADYLYANTTSLGFAVPLVGGGAIHGAYSGPFCVHANHSAPYADAGLGGRLGFKRLAA